MNVALLICVVGLFVFTWLYAKVYPLYQEASDKAYVALANIKDTDFVMTADTVIYDVNGNIIGRVNSGGYQYIEIDKVSPYVQNGYIAIEDKRFRQHMGVDLQSITRAGMSIFRHGGEVTQGGSTITQQVIKNCVLQDTSQTYERKLIEMLLAPKVEQMYSKPKIMEFYVNTCFYGNNCYGIEAASQYYFGKTCLDLSLAEAAMLCGVSNSPSTYNPVASWNLANEKKEQVLDRMLELQFISQEEYDEAKAYNIVLTLERDDYDSSNYMASYALHCAAIELMKADGFKFEYTFATKEAQEDYKSRYETAYSQMSAKVRSGGYSIYTSFDQGLQNSLQQTIDDNFAKYTELQDNGKYAFQGAGVCIDNRTGFVVAMVGGRGTDDEFNRAFLSTRQPGSTIKPLLVYAPAINEGIVIPSTIIEDKQVFAIEGDPNSYSPRNVSGAYYGDVTVREALARSLNTVAYQIYKKTGLEQSISYLDRMHFTSLDWQDNSAQSLCLGGFTNGVKVVEMAKGYSTLASGGMYSDRTCIMKIEHELDGVIFESTSLEASQTQVFTEDTAYMMVDMMQGTVEEGYGTAYGSRNANMIVGAKTGTTNSAKDLWCGAFTKYYTTVVWVGYDTPRRLSGMSSSGLPTKIAFKFLASIDENLTKADFDKPATISLRQCVSGNYVGEDLEVDYSTGRLYKKRTEGTEWYSYLNAEILETAQDSLELQESINIAERELDNFERMDVSTQESALAFKQQYDITYEAVELVFDEYKYIELRDRLNAHYEIYRELMQTWISVYEEEQENETNYSEDERQRIIELYTSDALEEIHAKRLERMNYLINQINAQSEHTQYVDNLLNEAAAQLQRLLGYSEYQSYSSQYQNCISYVGTLPYPTYENDLSTEVPQILPDEQDNY